MSAPLTPHAYAEPSEADRAIAHEAVAILDEVRRLFDALPLAAQPRMDLSSHHIPDELFQTSNVPNASGHEQALIATLGLRLPPLARRLRALLFSNAPLHPEYRLDIDRNGNATSVEMMMNGVTVRGPDEVTQLARMIMTRRLMDDLSAEFARSGAGHTDWEVSIGGDACDDEGGYARPQISAPSAADAIRASLRLCGLLSLCSCPDTPPRRLYFTVESVRAVLPVTPDLVRAAVDAEGAGSPLAAFEIY